MEGNKEGKDHLVIRARVSISKTDMREGRFESIRVFVVPGLTSKRLPESTVQHLAGSVPLRLLPAVVGWKILIRRIANTTVTCGSASPVAGWVGASRSLSWSIQCVFVISDGEPQVFCSRICRA